MLIDFVLTAHISLPNVTFDNLPATMNRKIVNDILIEELGFKGIVITDALDMHAISKYYTEEEIVKNTMNAGVDILLMPDNVDKMYNTFLKLVQDGEISEERVNTSVRKIIDVKLKRGIISK